MKIIMTDDVMEVSPGVMLFTKERLAEILEFARSDDNLPEHSPTTGAVDDCPRCGGSGSVHNDGFVLVMCPACSGNRH